MMGKIAGDEQAQANSCALATTRLDPDTSFVADYSFAKSESRTNDSKFTMARTPQREVFSVFGLPSNITMELRYHVCAQD